MLGLQNEFAIQTVNLSKTFKTKTPNINPFKRHTQSFNAIDNLNLAIKKGELYGLLGPNGAGKTTLVKMLCTLLPPDQGTATVNGYDISKQQMKVKQSLGTLFSVGERGFFWRLNGYRNLEFFAAIYNVPRQKRTRAHPRSPQTRRFRKQYLRFVPKIFRRDEKKTCPCTNSAA